LVALVFACAIKSKSAARQRPRRNIVAGCQHLGAKLTRSDKKIVELDRHIAVDAGHWRLAVNIALGETVDHRLLETVLVVEHVVRNADPLRHRTGIIDILTRTAGALAMDRCTMVVELQGHADHIVALRLEQSSSHRGVDAAGHGDNDTGVLRSTVEIETVEHDASYYRWRPKARNARAMPGRNCRRLPEYAGPCLRAQFTRD